MNNSKKEEILKTEIRSLYALHLGFAIDNMREADELVKDSSHGDNWFKARTHLCHLRYFGVEDRWSMAFYTYSCEKYEPCVFNNGSFHGTPEEAFETSAIYLED